MLSRFLHIALAKHTRPIDTSSSDEDAEEFNSAYGYGTCFCDRSLFNVSRFKVVPDPNCGGYNMDKNDSVKKRKKTNEW